MSSFEPGQGACGWTPAAFTHLHGARGKALRPEGILREGGDHDVEGISAGKTRSVDGGAHVRFDLGGPRGAIAVCNLSLDDAGPRLAL